MAKKSTTTTSNANVLGIVAWLLGIIGAIIVLIVEKKDKVARWHAKQSLVAGAIFFIWFILVLIISAAFIVIPGGFIISTILWLINLLVMLGYLALIVVGIIKAAQNQMWDVPIIADWAKKVNFL